MSEIIHMIIISKLELQHIEVEQQQQEEVMELEVQIEVQQQQKLETYEGELIGHKEFRGQPYSNFFNSFNALETVRTELFGNLPKAIKFLTPDAALVIAKHLTDFASLNADNLPQNFILRKSVKGELVLDYDMYASEQKTNKFTPKESPRYEVLPFYDVTVPKELLSKWLNGNNVNIAKMLDNLWIIYGNEGVDLF